MDKQILAHVTGGQLQFWVFLFLTIAYGIILLARKEKFEVKEIKKNYWIPIAAIALTLGDRFLFKANAIPESKVSILTIIQQLSVIEVIILGKFLFKEENIVKKLFCSIVIILGIAIILV